MIWIEILSRHREVAARLRFAEPEVRIGRGYDNDVIVDDPYVAARHLRICRDDSGRLMAEDMGTANGTFLDRDNRRHERIIVDGERPIRIGRTYLRIREAGHAVERERVARPEARTFPIVLAAALGVATLGIDALAVWFAETAESKASNYLTPLVTVTVAVVTWVAVWALLSRIFSARAQFLPNLIIALSGILLLSIYNEFAQFFAFALTWSAAVRYGYVVTWLILAVVCFFHLRELGRTRLLVKGALVATLFGLVIAVQTLQQSEALKDSGRQTTVRRLMPPALRLVPVRDENTFFAAIERLKSELDSDRTQARDDDR